MTYRIPANPAETEIVVKKSRFIARAKKANERQEALAFVAQARQDFPDARHHCWAYVLGNPASAASAAMNDAGEPSGTAGRPILNVIQHKGIGDVIVVVVRYFGGIKLGAGGLVRAYSGAAESVMSVLPVTQAVPLERVKLVMNFSQEQLFRHWASGHEAIIQQVIYDEHVNMHIDLPKTLTAPLSDFCLSHNIALQLIEDA